MMLVKKILNRLNGLHFPQEYLCLDRESFQDRLHVYLSAGNRIIKDITNCHLFTGYHPLLITLPSLPAINLSELTLIEMVFSQEPLEEKSFFLPRHALATLTLRLTRSLDKAGNGIYYFEAIRGQHRFLSFFNQYIIRLTNHLFNRKPGNVFLEGNLYTQVQIAYSVPRTISLITVVRDDLVNVFPTDLHGQFDEQYYIISLRHQGKACHQVEAAGRILITQVHCNAHKTVYSLGKNHMQDMKGKENFHLSEQTSAIFKLPVPEAALLYRELELQESFIHNIHRLLLFKIQSMQQLVPVPATLAHIHNCYATWRYKQGLGGNYLLR